MEKERIEAALRFWFSHPPAHQKVLITRYERKHGGVYDCKSWIVFLDSERTAACTVRAEHTPAL